MNDKKLNIKDWAEEDRPREKLILKGISSLSTAEILAILIGSGNKNETAVELSKKILESYDNNLNLLAKQSVNDLIKNFKGIGEAKAISIIAALELGKRRSLSAALYKKTISCSKDVFDIFNPIIGDINYEEFWVLFLNRGNKIIDKEKISQGGITGTVIDIKIILKKAIEKYSNSLILCHNHPSGNKMPSQSDKDITNKIKNAAKTLDIEVFDHIIITQTDYFSFADNNLFSL